MSCEQKGYEYSFWGRDLEAGAQSVASLCRDDGGVSDDGAWRYLLCQAGVGAAWRRGPRRPTGSCSTDEHGTFVILSYRNFFFFGGEMNIFISNYSG